MDLANLTDQDLKTLWVDQLLGGQTVFATFANASGEVYLDGGSFMFRSTGDWNAGMVETICSAKSSYIQTFLDRAAVLMVDDPTDSPT